MSVQTPEDAIQEIQAKWCDRNLSDANEAETRLLLIDEILHRVLGWPKESFCPEDHANFDGTATFIDYHLSAANGLRVVVEAKRIGTTFYFSRTRKSRTVSLSSLRSRHGDDLRDVIRQALQYCEATGTNQFIVTNGIQWIASINGWPNVQPSKLQAVVFRDIDDISSNLCEFLDLFSQEGISMQRVRDFALQSEAFVPAFAESLNGVHPNYPSKEKNYLVQPIESIMRACFDELGGVGREHLLDHCYVSNDASEGYFSRLELFVGKSFPSFGDGFQGKVDRAKFERRAGSDAFGQAARHQGEAVLLVGKVGSGKTTFIEFALRKLRSKFKGTSWVILHLNLINKTQLRARTFDHDKLVEELCSELLGQAETCYTDLNPFDYEVLRGTFSAEIQREFAASSPELRNSPAINEKLDEVVDNGRRNTVEHLVRYLRYLNGNRKIAVTVVVDNIDRGTQEFEEVVFTFARKLTAESGVTTVTAMRDTTYEHGRRGGFLDVSQNITFAIQPPAFLSVAAKRFDYVQNRLQNDGTLFSRVKVRLGEYPLDRVMDFVHVLAEIVLRESGDVRECIQSLAGTNVRLALEYLRWFSTSTNTDIERLLKDYNRKTGKGVPINQPLDVFVRSVMRMNQVRYSDKSLSPIINMFQVNKNQLMSHFTLIRVLQMLRYVALTARDKRDVAISDVVAAVSASPGHSARAVIEGVDHLGRHGLLLSKDEAEPPYVQDSMVRISASGIYYIESLIGNREYLRSVADDTIVYDADTHRTMAWMHNNREWPWYRREDEKAMAFLRYLHGSESAEVNRSGPRSQRPNWMDAVVYNIAMRAYGAEFAQSLVHRQRG